MVYVIPNHWIPAFAGMTAIQLHFILIVIPAKAGIQKTLKVLKKTTCY